MTGQRAKYDESKTTDESQSTSSSDEAVLFESTPTTKPALVKLCLTVIGTAGVVAYFLQRPVPNQGLITVIVALGGILSLRYAWITFLLRRTRYVVFPETIQREHELLGKYYVRKLPISQIRGTQLTRSRLQSLLGVGTIQFFTGGVSQSLGFVSFAYVSDPEAIDEQLANLQP